ncbi:AraC family transcriptional regulator [Aurantimonas sp. 22II-16-19i]|uniref:helix-turn-helix transcriptional regulator n=1 Tax=Aurantimonas sp. 22II-16-19i TaxID=1317114 RepID=UPI0009F8C98A|nr:AraC family transcriptional regulator [Aurantimonas sp. 22II-16-19i]
MAVDFRRQMEPHLSCEIREIAIGSSRVLARHVAGDGLGSELTEAPNPEDTYLICVQRYCLPRQELWNWGKMVSNAPMARHSIAIINLRDLTQSLTPTRFDSFHLEVPRESLSAFTQANHTSDVAQLGCRFALIDPLLSALVEAALPTLARPHGARSPVDQLFADEIILAMLAHVTHRYGACRPDATPVDRLDPSQKQRVLEMLSVDLARDIPLAELAGACGIPATHFAQAFRNTTGRTPSQWRRDYRIEYAKQLLFRTGQPLKEISHRCGFADPPHFSRSFAAAVGMTPAAWRRER